jgi:hypothetical protein
MDRFTVSFLRTSRRRLKAATARVGVHEEEVV